MKNLFLIIFIFLAACAPAAPQVTVTPEFTVTFSPPPTETAIPSPTTAPEFLSVQTQVAESTGDFTVLENGEIEGKLPDGTIGVISGITLDRDGQNYTITVNGEKVSIDAAKVKITDAGISVDGYTYDAAKGIFTEGFSLDAWVGTDQVRLEFVKILDALGYPRENVTCDEKGVCFDPEGNEIGRNGVFKLDFAKEAAIKYGNPKATPYGQKIGNVPPGTPTDEVNKYVTFPLVQRFLQVLKAQNGGVAVIEKGKSAFREIMISAESNSWGIILIVERSNPDSIKYFVFENENSELVIVSID